jgi:hypothetical protein
MAEIETKLIDIHALSFAWSFILLCIAPQAVAVCQRIHSEHPLSHTQHAAAQLKAECSVES